MTKQADNIRDQEYKQWEIDSEFCPVCGEALQFGDPPSEGWCENLNCSECDYEVLENADYEDD